MHKICLQVHGMPFVTCDSGGVVEMFDHAAHPEAVIWEASAEALSRRLQTILNNGQFSTVKLYDHFLTGRQQWLDWHAAFAANKTQFEEVCLLRPTCNGIVVVHHRKAACMTLKTPHSWNTNS